MKTTPKGVKPNKTNFKTTLTIIAALGILVSTIMLGIIPSMMRDRISTRGDFGEHELLAKPDDELSIPSQNNTPPDGFNNGQTRHFEEDKHVEDNNSTLRNIFIVIFALLFAFSLIYLVVSALNLTFWQTPLHWCIYLGGSLIITAIVASSNIITFNSAAQNDVFMPKDDTSDPRDETSFEEGNIANSNTINLSQQSSDLTITKSGQYTLSGDFTHSIVVDAPNADVELILNNVKITNSETAAIVGLNANKITITTAKDSQNTLSDGGNSVYDGCIYSNAELIFQGEGTLTVNGNQNEGEGIATEAQNITFKSGTYVVTSNDDGINAGGDGATITFDGGNFYINANGDGIDSNKNAIINGGTIFVIGSDTGGDAGIDTDSGFTINGGTVIALGSDMIETPLASSNQTSLSFTLPNSISKDTNVSLIKDGDNIISFSAPKSFTTVIISTPDLQNGAYQLSTGGTHNGKLINGIYTNGSYSGGSYITIDNTNQFTANQTVNIFGSQKRY